MSLDLVEGFATGGAGDRAPSTTRECPGCGNPFQSSKRNRRYCVPGCQKKASRKSARGSQKIADSPTSRRLSEGHSRRAWLLVDELFNKPPAQRPAFLETIIAAARDGDWYLGRILTDRAALAQFKGHPGTGRPTLARAVDDYCQRTREGARIWQVLANDWQDDPAKIHPLALYRDPWTNTEPDLGGPSEVHIRRDPASFLAMIRALPRKPVREDPADENPPSCTIRDTFDVTAQTADLV